MFVACGLNHKTAPLSIREKFALPEARIELFLSHLLSPKIANEAAILSTCNRTEFYCDTDDSDRLLAWFADKQQMAVDTLTPYTYIHHEHHGIRHALRVATGIDSMMLGEPQILGQMKQAYDQACKVGSIKDNLHYIFQYIFSASKRIRTQSGIGHNPVSIASAAIQFINRFFTHPASRHVFIIGSGETASLVAKYLQQHGITQFMIASRTPENANFLAQTLGGKTLTISDIPQYLNQADIIISATACPLPFITKNWVEHALQQRDHAPMSFLDLAVPRDIELAVAELPSVHLYNIDDLQQTVDHGLHERRLAAELAESLIEYELNHFIRSYQVREAKDVICNYRTSMQRLAEQELQRAHQKLDSGQCHYQVLSEFSTNLLNKLVHQPTEGLRKAAWNGRLELLELMHYLFNIESSVSPHETIN